MKRNKPCQHYRRIKTKKGYRCRLINKGIKKKKRTNYSFIPLSAFKLREMKNYKDEVTEDLDVSLHSSAVSNPDIIKFIDINKALEGHKKQGFKMDSEIEQQIRDLVESEQYGSAYELFPREMQMSTHLARSNVDALLKSLSSSKQQINVVRKAQDPIKREYNRLLKQGDKAFLSGNKDEAQKLYAEAQKI